MAEEADVMAELGMRFAERVREAGRSLYADAIEHAVAVGQLERDGMRIPRCSRCEGLRTDPGTGAVINQDRLLGKGRHEPA